MPGYALVTIGTAELWAPPKRAIVDVDSDLVISNRDSLSWGLEGSGCVCRAAIRSTTGWLELSMRPLDVNPGDVIDITPGGLRLEPTGRLITGPTDQPTPPPPAAIGATSRALPAPSPAALGAASVESW